MFVTSPYRSLAERMAGARNAQAIVDSRMPRTATIMAQRDTSILRRSF